MLILGIESSCDDTAAAVVEDGALVRSSIVSSQDSIHAKYGGIVPELASRRHIEMIIPVVDEALAEAGAAINDIDGIAVTQGPGLVGSILVGLSFAKAVSLSTGIPLTGINHITAHTHAAFLSEKNRPIVPPELPFVALIASGGHTTLLLQETHTAYRILGQTRDDAAGEAFDKVAKLLGLGYPGGAVIDRLAREGSATAYPFTRPYMGKGSLEFSFSGIKTAAMTLIKELGPNPDHRAVCDMAASFQDAAVDVLVKKTLWAAEAAGVGTIVAAGGVACNSRLRARLSEAAEAQGLQLTMPPARFCSDNGAMIAALGYHQFKTGLTADMTLNAVPAWDGF